MVAGSIAGLVLLAGCSRERAATPGSGGPPRHVFLITVDTLRGDHVSFDGYGRATTPALSRLAAQGVVFEQAYCQWPKTGTSFASMFTGRYPQTTGLMHRATIRIPAEYLSLPQLFQGAGYRTVGVVSNPVLGTDLGWNNGFDDFAETWGGGQFPDDPHAFRPLVHAGRVNSLALPLLEKHRADDRLFVWIHYSDPHAPYVLPAGATNPFVGDRLYTQDEKLRKHQLRGYALDGPLELRFYVSQYDANVLVVDRAVDQLLAKARELGLLDDALIIFTADHGESLGEHGSYFEHGPLPYNTTAHVPLFMVRTGTQIAAGRRVERPVELVDLFPTLRDLVAPQRAVDGLEGKSLVPFLGRSTPDPDAFRFAFSEAGEPPRHYRMVQDGKWKLIYEPGVERPQRRDIPGGLELYDLASDPGETRNLATQETEQVRRLRRELLSWMKTAQPKVVPEGEDEESLRALRALGYVK